MKTTKILLFLSILFIIASCNNQKGTKGNAKNLKDNALLVENARVEGEKTDDPQSPEYFVKEAASGGMMEVQLGQYAQQNASNPRVKNFGAMMVRDHSKANDELKSIAAGKNIPVPVSMDENQQNNANSLMKKSGPDFDKDYMKEMVDDHNKDVEEFRKQVENGKDPEIKAFAEKTLQVLIIHQDSAKQIHDAISK